MVKVRLARTGAKKRPFYHVVVTDSQSPRDGRFIEEIGIYDPRRPLTESRLDGERLEYWQGQGAQLSERVSKLVKARRKAFAAA